MWVSANMLSTKNKDYSFNKNASLTIESDVTTDSVSMNFSQGLSSMGIRITESFELRYVVPRFKKDT